LPPQCTISETIAASFSGERFSKTVAPQTSNRFIDGRRSCDDRAGLFENTLE